MKRIFLLSVFLLFINVINAQSVYNFEADNVPYLDLTGSTSLNNGVVWDDPGYTIPLGFSFNISTYTFDTVYILDWSTGSIVSSNPVDGDIIPIFSPITQDIIDLGFGTGISQSNISYKTEGTAGSRIFKLEWNNVGFFNDSTEADFMNLQLWLYEGSNTIEYRYGSSSINNPVESFEGETGPQISLGTSYDSTTFLMADNGYFLSENPVSPTVITLVAGDPVVFTALQGMMPSGTVYRFLQQPLGVQDFQNVDFVAYPNPVVNTININLEESDSQVSIFNSLGQLVKQFEAISNPMDVSELKSGIYFIQINGYAGIGVKKFSKL